MQVLRQGQLELAAQRCCGAGDRWQRPFICQHHQPARRPRRWDCDGLAGRQQPAAVEFVQFHPTALMQPGAPHFLLSGAARRRGTPGASRWPLFAVAGTAAARSTQPNHGSRHAAATTGALWRPAPWASSDKQFPTIWAPAAGWTPQMPLPVARALLDGGIADLIPPLPYRVYAVEVASSGMHGANRLASNSLSECLVMASQLSRLQPPTHAVSLAGLSAASIGLDTTRGVAGAAARRSQPCANGAGSRWCGTQRQAAAEALQQCEQLGEQLSLSAPWRRSCSWNQARAAV